MIPFLDLRAAYQEVQADIDAAVSRVLSSGWYIGGPEVAAFEQAWAEYCGAARCVGVGNGLDALVLALRACDIGPGDQVIVPSNTYIATWLAVSAVGATIRPVEPNIGTHNIEASAVAEAINPRTRAIIPVHLYGQPADLDPILTLAKAHNLTVIEDAAQCHGARYKERRIGSHGDVVCWSFYPGKNLGALGDGGAITTDNQEVADRIRHLSNYGSEKKYVHDERGVNSRLDPLQAAVLRVKLGRLDEWTQRRRDIAQLYHDGLAQTDVILPQVNCHAAPVWHLFVIRCKERDRLQNALSDCGVSTLIHYPTPPHLQKAYADLDMGTSDFPVAEELAGEILSLPIGPHLAGSDVRDVIKAVQECATC